MSLGIMAMALGVINYALIRNYPKSDSGSPAFKELQRKRPAGFEYLRILRDKRFWYIGIAYLFTGFSILIPFTFLSTYAVQELSFPYSSAALLITMIGIGGTIGKLILGPVSDRLGRIKIMILCALLIGGGSLIMAYGRGWLLMAVCFIYGIGYGACWSMYAACAADFFSKKAAGGIIGLWSFLCGFGSIIAPAVAGWSADASGTLMWAFIIATLGGFISLILLLPLARESPRLADDSHGVN
jgi:MFS family permease